MGLINTDEYFAIPEDITEIEDGAFAGNKKLKHIDLRNVKHVGAIAFQDCSNLETVIMSNAAVIGQGAFEFCRSLRSITFDSVTEIGAGAFSYCGMLDIPVMPRSIKQVGAAAFSHTAIRTADLHWLEEIPAALFSYCTSLTYADVSGAAVIGDEAFTGCRSLSYIRLGDTEKIGAKAFQRCDALEFARLPETLRSLGDDALAVIRDGLVVPGSVKDIGRNCLGPVDRRKQVRIYQSSLYEFRNYFRDTKTDRGEYDDEHFYLWESSIDVTVLDDRTNAPIGFLPLFSDLNSDMREALIGAFRSDNTFDYSVLDTVFMDEMKWNQRGKDRLAVMRSKYPYELSETAAEEYREYLHKHSGRIAGWAVQDGDIDTLALLFDNGLIKMEDITGLLDQAISLAASECTAFLLERRAEMNWESDPLIDEL